MGKKIIITLSLIAFVAISMLIIFSTSQLSKSYVQIKYNKIVGLLQQKEAQGFDISSLRSDAERARDLAEKGNLKEANDLLNDVEKKAKALGDGNGGGPEKLKEVDLIKDPTVKKVLDTIYDSRGIAEDGAYGRNKEEFSDVAAQRGAKFVILRGISDKDTLTIDKGIKALEYGFQFQESAGNFKNSFGLSPLEAISADAFFLQAVGHAALAIQDSEYSNEFSPRFDALKLNLTLAMDWLALPESQAELKRQDGHAPNRLVFDADAYTLNGIYLVRQDLQDIGDEFVQLALDSQRDDGVFPEKGGHDSSYQATTILMLEPYWLWTLNTNLKARIFNALEKGSIWEKTRIDPDTGEVSIEGNTRTGSCQEEFLGKCKGVSHGGVVVSMAYWSVIGDDEEAADLANKVLDFYL